jgi:hypothetical protein
VIVLIGGWLNVIRQLPALTRSMLNCVQGRAQASEPRPFVSAFI